jgi:hypothetical protein
MPFPTLPGEFITTTLQFALLLRDAVTNSGELVGDVTVTSGAIEGQQKNSAGTFLFYALKNGAQNFAVTCGLYTPYYVPTTIDVTLPMPNNLWPAFPDVTLANPSLPLGDPGQTAAYIAQRKQATLLPTNQYPFPAGSTLIRGTVTQGGSPLAGATIAEAGGTDPGYTTGADGQFVILVSSPPAIPQQVTLNVTVAGKAAGSATVTVIRGLTVSATINL